MNSLPNLLCIFTLGTNIYLLRHYLSAWSTASTSIYRSDLASCGHSSKENQLTRRAEPSLSLSFALVCRCRRSSSLAFPHTPRMQTPKKCEKEKKKKRHVVTEGMIIMIVLWVDLSRQQTVRKKTAYSRRKT